MNYIDVILLIPLAWGAFKGFKNGLISELGTVVALLFGVWLAVLYSPSLAPVVLSKTSISEQYATIAAFATIFLCVVIISFILSKLITKFFKAIQLQWLNMIAGTIFGVLKYAIVLSFVCFFIHTLLSRFLDSPVVVLESSALYKLFNSFAAQLLHGKISIPNFNV